MDLNRATWNRQQKILQRALSHPDEHPEAIELFLLNEALRIKQKLVRKNGQE